MPRARVDGAGNYGLVTADIGDTHVDDTGHEDQMLLQRLPTRL
jgi:hypothetical protein